jgi:dynein heavy chain
MANDIQSLADCVEKNKKQILELSELVRDPNLPDLRRAILVALITVDVHARDIVDDLRKE